MRGVVVVLALTGCHRFFSIEEVAEIDGPTIDDARPLADTGDGLFATACHFDNGRDYSVGMGVSALELVDVDGDDDLDIVSAVTGANLVSILYNDGAGSFGNPTEINSIPGPSVVRAARVSTGSTVDIVAVTSEHHIVISYQSVAGTFSPPTEYTAFPGATGLALADVDRDDTIDIATTTTNPMGHVAFLSGPDLFVEGSIPAPFTPADLRVADFKGDGYADLVVFQSPNTSQAHATTHVSGAGGYTPDSSLGAPFAAAFEVGKLDDDDKADVVFGGIDIRVFYDGQTTGPQVTLGTAVVGIAIGSFDDDQAREFVAITPTQMLVFHSTLDMFAVDNDDTRTFASDNAAVAAGNLDGHPTDDIVVAHASAGTITVFRCVPN